ncbi:SUMF1/EgtB/PvdO family nonheme iron enzyme [Ekhidna sp.]|uniref:SUMF1/EgtB/PvdO family nonheme iron enzyme n=1 Tax=Ekhidna sp. TaxID=2608089 RepID=UPI003512F8E7
MELFQKFTSQNGHIKYLLPTIICLSIQFSCSETNRLRTVTIEQFETFINETGYVTDAEKYGWSIVQVDVYNFRKVEGATWRKPDGFNEPKSKAFPVTQISYNDARAYCKWSGRKLPNYDEYWLLVKEDNRRINSGDKQPISEAKHVNVLGNVWDITTTTKEGMIRLAGGSYLCSPTTCDGTKKDRTLYVDKETGNIHIGFSVVD